MKIATYNINGVNGRLPVLIRWLEEAKPDVVCLQELKAQQDRFPERALLSAGYDSVWHGQKMWNGVAILSKDLPLQGICHYKKFETHFQAMIVICEMPVSA